MDKFPHLKFSEKLVGRARFNSNRGGIHPTTEDNKRNRQGHSEDLLGITTKLNTDWTSHIYERDSLHLAPLNEEIKPIFLQINPDLFADVNFDLQSLGIEIISEEENGFIIGASMDDLRSLSEKINLFAENERGGGKIADLWQIIDGNREDWKPRHILSPSLFKKWSTIDDNVAYEVEVSIAFDKPIRVTLNPESSRYDSQFAKYEDLVKERMNKMFERQDDFEDFIKFYNGKLISDIIELEDSFGCQISITGKGLKDFVINYPYVFEVSEVEQVSGITGTDIGTFDFDLEILPPISDAPEVGIIDSGIMEGHKFLVSAIKKEKSKSYVHGDSSVDDKVENGGHGTKVAGALLYPNGISHLSGVYQLPCFVRNLRVLNSENQLEHQFPAELMQKIVNENLDCKIFNLSICSKTPYRKKHMSLWAAMLDKLIHEKKVLFIAASGNITRKVINHYITNDVEYPHYLSMPYCRLANPAQSSFSIVVGSINHLSLDTDDWKSIGDENEVAPYSRIGSGIWGHIKPDVVEYGGGMQISKNGLNRISNKDTSVELLRSGGRAFNKESVGTSFATPKVTHIVAELLKLYKDEDINLIRALLVQGARLPNEFFYHPTKLSIQHFGYGVPSLKRVTENTEHRITFYNTNAIKAEEGQIYSLKIPQELREQGDEYKILIEVTLAYTAKNRRTRQKTKSYFSTWLEWKSSNLFDTYEEFKDRTLSELNGEKIENYERSNGGAIQWKIRERSSWGEVEEISRNKSSLQKDWVILNSYDLPEELHFAIVAHKGWDVYKEPIPYAITVSIEILGADIPIYESIRIENQVELPIET